MMRGSRFLSLCVALLAAARAAPALGQTLPAAQPPDNAALSAYLNGPAPSLPKNIAMPSENVSDDCARTFQSLLKAPGFEKFRFLDIGDARHRALLSPLRAAADDDPHSVQAMSGEERERWLLKAFSRAGLKLHKAAETIEELLLSGAAGRPTLEKAAAEMDFIAAAAELYSDSGAAENYASLRQDVRERLSELRAAEIGKKLEENASALESCVMKRPGDSEQPVLEPPQAMHPRAVVQELRRAAKENSGDDARRASSEFLQQILAAPAGRSRKLTNGLNRDMLAIKLHAYYPDYWAQIRLKRALITLLEKVASRTSQEDIKESVLQALAHDARMADDPEHAERAFGAVGRIALGDGAPRRVKALGRVLISKELALKRIDSTSLQGTMLQLPQIEGILDLMTPRMALELNPHIAAAYFSLLSMAISGLAWCGIPLSCLAVAAAGSILAVISELLPISFLLRAIIWSGVCAGAAMLLPLVPPSAYPNWFYYLLTFLFLVYSSIVLPNLGSDPGVRASNPKAFKPAQKT